MRHADGARLVAKGGGNESGGNVFEYSLACRFFGMFSGQRTAISGRNASVFSPKAVPPDRLSSMWRHRRQGRLHRIHRCWRGRWVQIQCKYSPPLGGRPLWESQWRWPWPRSLSIEHSRFFYFISMAKLTPITNGATSMKPEITSSPSPHG